MKTKQHRRAISSLYYQ